MVTCKIDDCPRRAQSQGWCNTHYMRWFRYGTTDAPPNAKRPKHVPFADWFWSFFVPNGDCLDWTRHTVDGYGVIRFEGRDQKAHRVAWILTNGPIPDGLHVLHTCDRRECARAAHLFLGTNEENIADKVRKGRQARGSTVRRSAVVRSGA